MQLLCHLRVMLRVICRRELSRRWLVSYACNHFTLCWSSMPNLSTNQTSKGTLETFVWVGGKQDFLERLLCIINNDSLWQTGLNRTCNMYLWVEGPAPAYSARSRSTKPIWQMRLESRAISPCVGNLKSTFLKFLPPFSSFLIDTLHLQESSTPVEELAAIWKVCQQLFRSSNASEIILPLLEKNTWSHI